MIKPEDIHGKKIAMIAWGKEEDGTDDVAVFTGIADWKNGRLRMLRDDGEPALEIYDEWIDRFKIVVPDLKGTLMDADYCFSVSIGNLPEEEEEDQSGYLKTGLKWPKSDEK